MKKIIIINILFFYSVILFGQKLSNQTVNTGGGSAKITNRMITYSVGEVFSTTLNNGSKMLTQGFQQGQIKIVGIEDITLNLEIKAYPNPTQGLVGIYISDFILSEKSKIEVFDLQGKQINTDFDIRRIGTQSTIEINFSNLKCGYYNVRIIDRHKQLAVVKILKNN